MKVVLLFVLAGWLLLDGIEGHSSNVFLRDVEHTHDDVDHVEEKQQAAKTATPATNVKVNTPVATADVPKDNSVDQKPQAAKTATPATNVKVNTPVATADVPEDNSVDQKPQVKTTTTPTNVKATAPITATTSSKDGATVAKPVVVATVQTVEEDIDGSDEDDEEGDEIDAEEITIVPETKVTIETVVPEKLSEPIVDDDDEEEEEDNNVEETVKEDSKTTTTTQTGSGQSSDKTKTESPEKEVEDKIKENLKKFGSGNEEIVIIWDDENVDEGGEVGEDTNKVIGAIIDWNDEDYQGDEGYIEEDGQDGLNENGKSFDEWAGEVVSKGDEVGDVEDNYKIIDSIKSKQSSGSTDQDNVPEVVTLTSGKGETTSEGDIEGAGKGPLNNDDEDDFDDEDDVEEELKPDIKDEGNSKKEGAGSTVETESTGNEGVCVKDIDDGNCNEDSDEESWTKWLFDWLYK